MKNLKNRNVLFILVIPVIILVLSIVCNIKNIALWLYLRDPVPAKLDVICTFAGDPKREIYALELYRTFQPIWIVSSIQTKGFIFWAERNGVDTTKLILNDRCRSTWEEIHYFNKVLHNLKRQNDICENAVIGFVSSHYHMRRITITNSLISKGHDLKILSLPVPIERNGFSLSDAEKWWRFKEYRNNVIGELVKMIADLVSVTPIIGSRIRNSYKDRINQSYK